MDYITSRNFRLPELVQDMDGSFWFNMWRRRLWPFAELDAGDHLFWYETPTQTIVWDTTVLRVERFEYRSHKDAVAKLESLFGSFDTHQNYVEGAPTSGICLAYSVGSATRVSLSKPKGMRFPQEGWLRVQDDATRAWTAGLDGSKARNPVWTRDELILALDLYFRHHPSHISKGHAAVVELSDVLNALGERLGRVENEKFRNPNGVYMKLCNFLRFDPTYKGKGLTSGGAAEEDIWRTYANDRGTLQQLASAIRASIAEPKRVTEPESGPEEETSFPEGAVLYRKHIVRERNRGLVVAAKSRALRRDGHLRCEVCGFDYAAVYGEVGRDFIECHHTTPISELPERTVTRLEEVVLVCSNCHRMIHRRRPWLRVTEIRTLVSRPATKA